LFQNKSRKKELKMKKLNWMVSCLFLSAMGSSFAMADETPVGGFSPRIGIEGGFNVASLNDPTPGNVYASRLGFVGGGFINLPLGPTLSLQPELLYSQKGGQINGNSYQVDYFEVPVLLDINIIGPVGILAGVAFDANLASQGLTTVNRTDVGLVAGVQVFLSKFLVSGRYEIGLTDVDTTTKIQNGTFTLMAGLSFI
jgi:hypothetical protein